MNFTDAQLLDWMQQYLCIFTRIGAALMAAPLFGTHTPMRARLFLTVLLTLVIAPLTPVVAMPESWSAAWYAQIARQLLIGITIGFVLRLVFEAVMLSGELIANSMGLGFAQMADPVRGSSPVLGQFMVILASLLFLSMGGHLLLVQSLAQSFTDLPLNAGLSAVQLQALVLWAGLVFAGGVQIALPAMMGLLLVNLAFGVMSRAAPTLNLMAVGFPVSLIAGLVLLQFSLPGLQTAFAQLLDTAWGFIAELGPVEH